MSRQLINLFLLQLFSLFSFSFAVSSLEGNEFLSGFLNVEGPLKIELEALFFGTIVGIAVSLSSVVLAKLLKVKFSFVLFTALLSGIAVSVIENIELGFLVLPKGIEVVGYFVAVMIVTIISLKVQLYFRGLSDKST